MNKFRYLFISVLSLLHTHPASTARSPVIQSLNVTVNDTSTIFQTVNGSLQQPVIQLGPSSRVRMVVQATDLDPAGPSNSTGNIMFVMNLTLGSLLVESEDMMKRLLSRPNYLAATTCAMDMGSLCQARTDFLCRESISNVIGLSDPGCARWPSSLDRSGVPSTTLLFLNGVQVQNQSTFAYSFFIDGDLQNSINFANPYRQVCVQAISPGDLIGQFDRSTQLCVVFRFPALSVPLNCEDILPGFSLLLNPSTFPLTGCGARSLLSNSTRAQSPSCGLGMGDDTVWCRWPITIALGQSLRAKVYFKSYNVSADPAASSFQIRVLPSPGLPNGASISPTRVEYVALHRGDPSSAFLFPVFSREIVFNATPADLQVAGRDRTALLPSVLYRICFAGPGDPDSSDRSAFCGGIRVIAPEPRVLVSGTDFPLAAGCFDGGPCDGRFGMTIEVTQCGSAAFQTRRLLLDGTVVCAPSADEFEFRVRCDYAWTLRLFDARSEEDALAGLSSSRYSPILVEDPTNPLPPGAALSAPEEELRTFDAVGEHVPRRLTRQTVTWSPRQGTEGRRYRICLILTDRAAPPGWGRRVCSASLAVRKCEACTRLGDTLGALSAEFGTDWLQLWGANGRTISDPDRINTTAVPYVFLGPLYRTAAGGESTDIIAATFGITPAALVTMNPDLDLAAVSAGRPAAVPGDSLVCLVPSLVCKGPASGAASA